MTASGYHSTIISWERYCGWRYICKLALFRIDAGEYEKIPENFWSGLDMEVHEHPVLQGKIGEIRASLEHHDEALDLH